MHAAAEVAAVLRVAVVRAAGRGLGCLLRGLGCARALEVGGLRGHLLVHHLLAVIGHDAL